MGKNFHIEPDLELFLDEVLPALTFDEIKTVCPYCGNNIFFPLIVRQRDIERIEYLIKIIEKYADDKGATREKIIAELIQRIKERLTIQ